MDKIFLKKKEKIDNAFKTFKSKSPYPILNGKEVDELINNVNSIYGLMGVNQDDILSFLIKSKYIESLKIKDFDLYKVPESQVDSFDIAHSLFRSTHFSYYSALFINNLTQQIPKTIYLNYERKKDYTAKSSISDQSNIDNAFSNPPRVSTNIVELPQFDICYLQSKNYNKIGLVPYREIYQVTGIERTLIDITVRPFYAGGVIEVLNAYERAKDRLDVDKLYEFYKSMDFIYPYHQAIGFYLQKAGYSEKHFNLFKNFDFKYNFYLTYNILNKEFSKEWMLYFPKGL